MNRRPLAITSVIFSLSLLVAALHPVATRAQNTLFSLPQNTSSSSMSATNDTASQWEKGHKSRVRIISDDTDFATHGSSYAGVQVQIAKGWKTYWRSPGDSGVPPSFDWSGSRNLKSINILWPAPQRYKDEYSTSIGYKHEVILPLKVIAMDKKKPVHMKLRFGYGICADICVPVEADLKLTISPRQSGHKTLLSHYRSMVPKPVKTTGTLVNGFSIHKVTIDLNSKKPSIIIDAKVPAHTKKAELYVEASNGFYLPLPIREQLSKGNVRRFHIDLTKSDPPKGLKGKTLAFTLVGDKAGIEYNHKIN